MIPTRKRQDRLITLLHSIYKNAVVKDKIEVLVTYDNDDQSTIDALPNLKAICNGYPVQFFARERHYSINCAYYNEMAQKATGKFLIAVNDDTIFQTMSWDLLTLSKLEDYLKNKQDGIVYGITNDKEREDKRNESNWFSCFPLISKKAVDTLGFFFDPGFPKDGADWDIVETYRDIDRVLDLRETIIIEHISYRSGRRERDLLDHDSIPVPNEHSCSAGQNKDRNAKLLWAEINKYVKPR